MNTMFQKKRINQYTWQHPGAKLWHCIDYVLLHQSQHLCCTDVTVFHSAQCWTDHKLLSATLKYAPVVKRKFFLLKGRRRFNIAPLTDSSFVSRFTDHVVHLVNSRCCAAVDGLAQWTVIKESLLEADGEMLGWSSRKHPDWFIAAESIMRTLIDKRNWLFSLWLISGCHGDQQQYLMLRWCVTATVRTCKNQRFKDMANSVQSALAQGNPSVMWRDIQAICQCRSDLQPVRPRTIRKQDGSFCFGPAETVGRWREHFEGVLNVESSFDQVLIDDIPQFPLRGVLSDPPSEDEVRRALGGFQLAKLEVIMGFYLIF